MDYYPNMTQFEIDEWIWEGPPQMTADKFTQLLNFELIQQNEPTSDSVTTIMNRLVSQEFGEEDQRNTPCECRMIAGKRCCLKNRCFHRQIGEECPESCGPGCCNAPFRQDAWKKKTRLAPREGRGFGLLAMEKIQKGEYIMEYQGQVFEKDKNPFMPNSRYACEIKVSDQGREKRRLVVDPTAKGNWGRFLACSHEPNCKLITYCANGTLHNIFVAIRVINIGGELVWFYGEDYKQLGIETCLCLSWLKCPDFHEAMKKLKNNFQNPAQRTTHVAVRNARTPSPPAVEDGRVPGPSKLPMSTPPRSSPAKANQASTHVNQDEDSDSSDDSQGKSRKGKDSKMANPRSGYSSRSKRKRSDEQDGRKGKKPGRKGPGSSDESLQHTHKFLRSTGGVKKSTKANKNKTSAEEESQWPKDENLVRELYNQLFPAHRSGSKRKRSTESEAGDGNFRKFLKYVKGFKPNETSKEKSASPPSHSFKHECDDSDVSDTTLTLNIPERRERTKTPPAMRLPVCYIKEENEESDQDYSTHLILRNHQTPTRPKTHRPSHVRTPCHIPDYSHETEYDNFQRPLTGRQSRTPTTPITSTPRDIREPLCDMLQEESLAMDYEERPRPVTRRNPQRNLWSKTPAPPQRKDPKKGPPAPKKKTTACRIDREERAQPSNQPTPPSTTTPRVPALRRAPPRAARRTTRPTVSDKTSCGVQANLPAPISNQPTSRTRGIRPTNRPAIPSSAAFSTGRGRPKAKEIGRWCRECNPPIHFPSTGNYTKHRQRKHDTVHAFECPICDKSFPTKQQMTKHIQTHKLKKDRKRVRCLGCGQLYIRRDFCLHHQKSKFNKCKIEDGMEEVNPGESPTDDEDDDDENDQ